MLDTSNSPTRGLTGFLIVRPVRLKTVRILCKWHFLSFFQSTNKWFKTGIWNTQGHSIHSSITARKTRQVFAKFAFLLFLFLPCSFHLFFFYTVMNIGETAHIYLKPLNPLWSMKAQSNLHRDQERSQSGKRLRCCWRRKFTFKVISFIRSHIHTDNTWRFLDPLSSCIVSSRHSLKVLECSFQSVLSVHEDEKCWRKTKSKTDFLFS